MWLRVPSRGELAAVRVDVEGRAQGSDVVRALVEAQAIDAAHGPTLAVARTGALLDVDVDLQALDLRNGDRLTTDPHPGTPTTAVACLVVASGPDAGRQVPLAPGTSVVGRSREAQVTVADRGLSRSHFALTVADDGVTVQDLGSRNGTFLQGAPTQGPTPWKPDLIVEAGSSAFRLVPADEAGAPRSPVPLPVREGRAQFNRPPRVRPEAPAIQVAVRRPPDPKERSRIPLATAFAPLLLVPVLAVMGAGGAAMAAMALLSPVIALASYGEDRFYGARGRREAEQAFHESVAAAEATLRRAGPAQAAARWRAHPDPAAVVDRTDGPRPDLWDRRPNDPDFLTVRIGWGDLPAPHGFEIAEGGDDALRQAAVDRLAPLLTAPCAPVTVDLAHLGAVAITGEPAHARQLGRWVVAQLAALHSPRDLTLAVAADDDTAWGWVQHLPHHGPLDPTAPRGATVERAPKAAAVLGAAAAEVDRRRARAGRHPHDEVERPAWVVVVDDDHDEALRSLVTAVAERGPAVGVHLVWLGTQPQWAPGACQAVAAVTEHGASLQLTAPAQRLEGLTVDHLPLPAAERLAWNLAGLRDTGSRDAEAQIPDRATLAEVLALADPTAHDIEARWGTSRGLEAPLGLTSGGVHRVDLRRDGPHALLGGTTGAGKSELLQTLVGSLAAHHPPERLTFLLVDYKGGAAFKDCVALPHVVGSVTDLDGHLVQRVLVSLQAELSHRERILARAGAKDLVEMEGVAPAEAPPALVIVVDEFAALAAELPEFVDGVVNLAQRGRSLGMHLVLATQRPAGAINDNIRANTNLRISLRMNDVADSEDVLGSPVAAALPRSLPGRAYVRTGADELTAVQIAYSAGRSFGADRSTSVVTVHVPGAATATTTRRRAGFADAVRAAGPDAPTDLQALVAAVGAAHLARGGTTPRRPWLEPLPPLLIADELPSGHGTGVVLGTTDEPERQAQDPFVVDLATDGAVLVAGTGGAGKTTALRTLVHGLASQLDADALHLYALDFAARGLDALGALPACGAVVAGDDLDRAARLLSQVERWMRSRREAFGAAGVTTLEALQEAEDRAGAPRTPRIVILLDGYGAFAQAFERIDYGRWIDRLPLLVTEGRSLGIHWVVTVDRRLTLPGALAASFDTRLVLRLADPDDYDSFGIDRSVATGAALPPGRGFLADGIPLQVAVAGGPDASQQAAALTAAGRDQRARCPGAAAPPIRLLPEQVAPHDLPVALGPHHPVLGLDDVDLGPIGPDLRDGHLLVAGPNRAGKSTALATLASSLRVVHPDAHFVLVAPGRTPLRRLELWATVLNGSYESEDALETLAERWRAAPGPTEAPLVLVVDDAHELMDTTVDEHLDALARLGPEGGVHVLAAADRTAAHRAYGGVIHRVRGDRHGLLLQPDTDTDGDLLGIDLDRRLGGGPVGRGVLVRPAGAIKVQCAAPPTAHEGVRR